MGWNWIPDGIEFPNLIHIVIERKISEFLEPLVFACMLVYVANRQRHDMPFFLSSLFDLWLIFHLPMNGHFEMYTMTQFNHYVQDNLIETKCRMLSIWTFWILNECVFTYLESFKLHWVFTNNLLLISPTSILCVILV